MQPLQDLRPSSENWLRVALADIGMATIRTDTHGLVLELNTVAEAITGWRHEEAVGRPLAGVFRIEDEKTRRPVPDAVARVVDTGEADGLSDHTVLIARDGRERRIDHGVGPVRDATGSVDGAILFFCDVSERQRIMQGVEDARAFAEGIVQTVREPLVILDAGLRVWTANHSFYQTFRVASPETEGQSLFALGDGEWDIPELRDLLEQVLPRDSHFDDFEVDHDFRVLGRRLMILNARRLPPAGGRPALILLAIEDATERRRAVESLALSETRYRRLFETAQDGILLVDPDTRRIFDANPFLTDMLGYARDELVGRELWEIGLFRDIESSKEAFRTLQGVGYIRYDDLPLRTHDDRGIEVEFVSNVYAVGDTKVIQCNIRDVTDRKRAQDALRVAHAGLEVRVEERTIELASTNGKLTTEIGRREVAEADRRDLQQQLTTVQEDERRRIARELHDELGQYLTALGLGLKLVKDATPDPSAERDRLLGLQSLTDRIGRQVHHLALELRPTALDDLGLHAALANYAEGWSERAGVEVDFQGPGPDAPRLPPPIETALYRVIQEALTNVLKHAAALRVSVVLRRSAGQATALIEDDGRGFDADSVAPHRLGVLGMRERAELVGGTLTVESSRGRGTTVIARIPLPSEEGRNADG
ncbi:PAS domain-containing sensor histidine kinase [Limnoglobus roseus]|uniref:histidine kinase n=1 Tax=Limnoglobus roseus TaxID=2598579 RepID=A0A5C1ADS7_9BACT|nr:PAS domain S-box protein [Limnoglobus roseus]QEL16805.1 PAS domain S-box protein [Limnoglobus roseus]